MYGLGWKQASLTRNVRCSLRDEPNNGHAEDNATLNVGSEQKKKNRDCITGVECVIHRMYTCTNVL